MIEVSIKERLNEVDIIYGFSHGTESFEYFKTLIKLHGSFYDKENNDISDTIKTTIENITKGYSKDARLWLSNLFNDYFFIFIGYSGSDKLDIIPSLIGAPHSQFLWIDHAFEESDLAYQLEDLSMYPAHLQKLFYDEGHYLKSINTLQFIKFLYKYLTHNDYLVTTHNKNSIKELAIPWHTPFANLTAGFIMIAFSGEEQLKALKYFSAFIEKNTNNNIYVARAHIGMAQVLELFGHYDEALANYIKGLYFYTTNSNKKWIGMTLNDIGLCLISQSSSSNNEVEKYFIEAQKIAHQINDNELLCVTYHNFRTPDLS